MVLNTKEVIILCTSIAVGIIIFVIDLFTDSGVTAGMPYIVLMLSCLWFPIKKYVYSTAITATVLTVIGCLLSPYGDLALWIVTTNRFLAIGALWVAAVIALYFITVTSFVENSKLNLESILKSAVDAIVVIDKNGSIESFNNAAEKIFGYDCNEVIGHNVKMLMPQPYADEHDTYISNFIKTGQKKIIGINRESSGKKKNGDIFPIELSVSETNRYGEYKFTGVIRDITDKKLAEQKLQNTISELERSNRDLEEFTYVASHDLQEPLRKIHSFSTLLVDSLKEQLDETQNRHLKYVIDGTKCMQDLINDLLLLSRINRTEDLMTDKCNLSEIANKVARELDLKDEQIVGLDSLPVITGNLSQIGQLFYNIIGNAIKYKKSDIPLKIQITTEVLSEQKYKISIQDNGIGFDNKNAQQIFETFKRLHGKKKYSGSGIGLSICHRIVQRHGGTIGAIGNHNKGATFWFII